MPRYASEQACSTSAESSPAAPLRALFWSAANSCHISYESRLGLDCLGMADFAPEVRRIAGATGCASESIAIDLGRPHQSWPYRPGAIGPEPVSPPLNIAARAHALTDSTFPRFSGTWSANQYRADFLGSSQAP